MYNQGQGPANEWDQDSAGQWGKTQSFRVSAWPHKRTGTVQFRVKNQSVTKISGPYDHHWCATDIRVQHVSRVSDQHESWSSSQLVTRVCVQHVFRV